MSSIIRSITEAVNEKDSETIEEIFGNKDTKVTEYRITDSGKHLPLCPRCNTVLLTIGNKLVCPSCHYTE